MISGQTLRVCREGKTLFTFRIVLHLAGPGIPAGGLSSSTIEANAAVKASRRACVRKTYWEIGGAGGPAGATGGGADSVMAGDPAGRSGGAAAVGWGRGGGARGARAGGGGG